DHACLRTESDGRPVLSTPKRRTKVGHLSRARLAVRIHFRSSGLGVQTLVHILVDERLALDKADLSARSFQKPQVAVAADVNQTFIRSRATFEIDEDWR